MFKCIKLSLCIAAVLLVAVLAGCGGEGGDSKTSGSTGSSSNPAPAVKEEPRTIKHAKGETKVPASPQKIALINDNAFEDNMLAMGVKPYIGSTFAWSEKKFYPHIADELQGVHGMDGQAPNLEQLSEWKPDLIIISGQNEKFYDQLSKIAPTVQVAFNADWRVTHMQLAEIVGKTKEAEKNLQDYDKKLAEIKSDVQKAIGQQSVMVTVINEKTIRIQGATGHALNDLLYKDLGLAPAKGIPAENRVEVSLEGMSTFNPDHIFMQRNRFSTIEQVVKNVQDSNVWKNISAVKQGNVYNVDNWLAMSWGPKGRSMILDQIKKDLTAKK
jgi:iron complex transport system substrate-binding protein